VHRDFVFIRRDEVRKGLTQVSCGNNVAEDDTGEEVALTGETQVRSPEKGFDVDIWKEWRERSDI
jgi:hypothetical protein